MNAKAYGKLVEKSLLMLVVALTYEPTKEDMTEVWQLQKKNIAPSFFWYKQILAKPRKAEHMTVHVIPFLILNLRIWNPQSSMDHVEGRLY